MEQFVDTTYDCKRSRSDADAEIFDRVGCVPVVAASGAPSLKNFSLEAVARNAERIITPENVSYWSTQLSPHVPTLLECLSKRMHHPEGRLPWRIWWSFASVFGASDDLPEEYRDYDGVVLDDTEELSSIACLYSNPRSYPSPTLVLIDLSDSSFDDSFCRNLNAIGICVAILKLGRTKMTDYGMHILTLASRNGAWKRLRFLGLDGTKVTDQTLDRLDPLPKIAFVDVQNTQCTAPGASKNEYRQAISQEELEIFQRGKDSLTQTRDNIEFYYPSRGDRNAATVSITKVTRDHPRLIPTPNIEAQWRSLKNAHTAEHGKVYSNVGISIEALWNQKDKSMEYGSQVNAENQVRDRKSCNSVRPCKETIQAHPLLLVKRRGSTNDSRRRDLPPTNSLHTNAVNESGLILAKKRRTEKKPLDIVSMFDTSAPKKSRAVQHNPQSRFSRQGNFR